jgi:IS30 family transposase
MRAMIMLMLDNHSQAAIARKLGRSPSTISREFRREPEHGHTYQLTAGPMT